MTSREQGSLEELTALALVNVESAEIDPTTSIIGLKIGPFNAALHRRREELGLTQKVLAQRVGFKTSLSISSFETLRAFPKPDVAQRIADVLGVNPEDLFPEWLRLFTRDKKQPAQIRLELPESEVNRLSLRRAYQTEALTAPDPYKEVEDSELQETVGEVLSSLTPRERKVLRLRFGLEKGKGHSYEEIGEELGVTGDRIRQIEVKGLRKLRHPSRAKHLQDFAIKEKHDQARALINGAANAVYSQDRERALGNLQQAEELTWEYLRWETVSRRFGVNIIECEFLREVVSQKQGFSFWTDQDVAEYLFQFIQKMPDETIDDKTWKSNIVSFVQLDQILVGTLKKIDEINRLRLQAAKLGQ